MDQMTIADAREGLDGLPGDATLMIEVDGEYYSIEDIGGFRRLDDHGDVYVALAHTEEDLV